MSLLRRRPLVIDLGKIKFLKIQADLRGFTMNKVHSSGGCRGQDLGHFPLSPNREVPFSIDANVIAHIFAFACQGSPRDFKNITLVSKNWKEFIAGDVFRRALNLRIAPEIFGRADFIKYIGGDPGEEFPIPFEYLIKFKSGRTRLQLFPKSLQFTQADGTVLEEPCTLQNMGKWASNAKGDYQIGYRPKSWKGHIQEDRHIEETHWSFFIDMELIGQKQVYALQVETAQEEGGEVSGISDTVLSLLMAYVKMGIRYLSWGEGDCKMQLARVQETSYDQRLHVGFAEAGLEVGSFNERAYANVGVVVARKFFGH